MAARPLKDNFAPGGHGDNVDRILAPYDFLKDAGGAVEHGLLPLVDIKEYATKHFACVIREGLAVVRARDEHIRVFYSYLHWLLNVVLYL
jgi:hypothetical protein